MSDVLQAGRGFAITMLALLSSCAGDVRSVRLIDVDLSDGAVVQTIAQTLPTDQRVALRDYVVRHRMSSASFCGKKLIGQGGSEPTTIGEAIDLTIARQSEEARRDAQKPTWATRWEELTRQRDRLLDQQGILLAEHGSAAPQMQEWAALEASLAENGRDLLLLRGLAQGQ